MATGSPTFPASPTRATLDGDAVQAHPFVKGDDTGEAARAVDLIEAALHERDGTVAVLARRRADLVYIIEELKRRRIGIHP